MKNVLLLISLVLLGSMFGCKKSEIAQWRGVDRNGIFQESGLMEQWPEEGPELLWVYEGLGRGYAAPAVTSDQIFVNVEEDGKSFVYALNLSGELLWKSPNGVEFLGEGFSSSYPGARATPTVYNDLVYTSSGTGRVACYDAATGEEKWGVDLMNELGGLLGYFGYSESLAVDKEHLYCFPGGAENNLVSLDRFTGEIAWSSEIMQDTFAYGSPILVDLPERDILISTSRHYLYVVDRSNGELLSSYELEGYEVDGEHCNSPIYIDGHIYFVANDVPGPGAIKLALSEDGRTITEIWQNNKVMNNFSGFVVVDEKIFTLPRGGKLLALAPEDGSITDSLKVSSGSISFADNKFFCYAYNGVVNMVTYADGNIKHGGSLRVTEGSGHHFSHPVLSQGVLYIRHGDALMAYSVAGG